MKAETLARLEQIARGEIVPKSGVTGVTGVTRQVVTPRKPASLHLLHLLHLENDKRETTLFDGVTAGVTGELSDPFDVAERAAIAIELGRVPPAYADAWAAFQMRRPGRVSEAEWFRAVDDSGRFLDEWAWLALDFGWRPPDIFGPDGLAWFCAGERVRALGPDNAITVAGRVFTRTTANLVGRRGADSRSNPCPGR
jgi:hypothetical protein